jgi:hypothetical protein
MANAKNSFQAKTMAEKCKQLRLHACVQLDYCTKHVHPMTQDQLEDNSVVRHLTELIKVLESTEQGLKQLVNVEIPKEETK